MIAYILKSSLSLIILFGLYWCLLRKEKLFEFNRFFLILSVVFSLLVPLISIPVHFRTVPRLENLIPVSNNSPTEIVIADNIVPDPVGENRPNSELQPGAISFSAILLALYVSGVILLLFRFLKNIYVLIYRTRSSEKTILNGYQIVLTNDRTDPCCFFNTIFLYRDDYLNGRIGRELIDHELEHAKQSHTIDIIIIEIVRIFYWFNPVYILYDRAIRINHEYLADNAVIKDVPDIRSYADKLVSFITWRSSISLTSNSNSSFTRMRLIMIMKSRSGWISYGARITFTLCSGVVLFLLLALKESDIQPVNIDLSGSGTIKSTTEKAEQNKENGSSSWWVSIAKLRNIDLNEFHSVIIFSMRNRVSSKISAFCAGKNDSIVTNRSDGKIQSFELLEPVLILKDTIGYELLKAKSAFWDFQKKQISFEKGSIEQFIFGEEWLEKPKYANDIKPGKKVSFDSFILNIETNERTFKGVSGTMSSN